MPTERAELVFQIRVEGDEKLERVYQAIHGGEARLKSNTRTLGEYTSGLTKATEGTLGLSTGTVALALRAGGAAASVGVLAKQVSNLVLVESTAVRETANLATRLGLTLHETERLQAAARITGVNLGSMESAATALSQALRDQSGAGSGAAEALRTLGVQTFTAKGEQRELGEVFTETLRQLSRVQDASQRTLLAQRTLGSETANALAPVIDQYRQIQTDLDRIGVGLDDNLNDRLLEANKHINELSVAWEQFKRELAARIAPIVIPIVTALTPGGVGRQSVPSTLQGLPSGVEALTRGSTDVDIATIARRFRVGPSERDQRQSLAEAFRLEQSRTEEGLRARLKEIASRRGELSSQLGSGALSVPVFEARRAEFDTLTAEAERIEAQLKDSGRKVIDTTKRISDLLSSLNERGLDPVTRLLYDVQGRLSDLDRSLTAEEQAGLSAGLQGAIKRTGQPLAEIPIPINAALPFSVVSGGSRITSPTLTPDSTITEEILADLQDRKTASIARYVAYQENVLRLTAGPGGELAAIEQIADLRIKTAERQFQLTQDRAQYEAQIDEARFSRETAILELQNRRLQDYRNQAGQVFDSLNSRGGASFLEGQLTLLQRQLFVNSSASLFEKSGGFLGRIGAASGLGDLLKGTVFDPANAEDKQVTALDANRRAIEDNTATLKALGIRTTPSGSSLIDAAGGIFSGVSGSNPFVFFNNSGSSGGGVIPFPQTANTGGGLSGFLSAASPYIAGASLAFSLIKSLLPDPKEEFDRSQTETLVRNRYVGPSSQTYGFDIATGGTPIESNIRGQTRVVYSPTINMQVQAWDAKSFRDNQAYIAEAVGEAVESGSAPRLNQAINKTIFGPGAA